MTGSVGLRSEADENDSCHMHFWSAVHNHCALQDTNLCPEGLAVWTAGPSEITEEKKWKQGKMTRSLSSVTISANECFLGTFSQRPVSKCVSPTQPQTMTAHRLRLETGEASEEEGPASPKEAPTWCCCTRAGLWQSRRRNRTARESPQPLPAPPWGCL